MDAVPPRSPPMVAMSGRGERHTPRDPDRPRRRHAPDRGSNLSALIERLGQDGPYDGPDVTPDMLKGLLLQFVVDQPDDDPASARRPAAKLRLAAMDLIAAIMRDQQDSGAAEDLLALLAPAGPAPPDDPAED